MIRAVRYVDFSLKLILFAFEVRIQIRDLRSLLDDHVLKVQNFLMQLFDLLEVVLTNLVAGVVKADFVLFCLIVQFGLKHPLPLRHHSP